jgi:tetratricopeptide (TPR) repeat protein
LFADALTLEGRHSESLEEIDKAQELDPGSHATLADKGAILIQAGKTEEGIALLREVERSAPELSSPHHYLMENGFVRRDYPVYLAEGEKTAETMNDPVLRDIIASARLGYARDGERGLLKNVYVKQEQYYAEGRFQGQTLAFTCVRLGKNQEALQLLEEAYAHREANVSNCIILGAGNDWISLKNEPGFKALLEKARSTTAPREAPLSATPATDVSGAAAQGGKPKPS